MEKKAGAAQDEQAEDFLPWIRYVPDEVEQTMG
jgi:hypothetical protein